MVMVSLLAAALVAIPAAPTGVSASAQATATIRVVRAVRLRFDGTPDADVPPLREAELRIDGSIRKVKLIEFQ